MGSFAMHIAITNIVRKRLNLSSKFIYGCILPDLVKIETGDRTGTHFLKTVVTEGIIKKLPRVDDAARLLSGKLDEEIKLGYVAHLIEDFIWFDKYIPSYARHIEEGRVVYLGDSSIHPAEEFCVDIYDDYAKINAYITDKYCKEYYLLKSELATHMTKKELELLNVNDKATVLKDIDITRIITKESLDKYIEESVEIVEEKLKELLRK